MLGSLVLAPGQLMALVLGASSHVDPGSAPFLGGTLADTG